MSNKKRKLSPSVSSRSSATPAPASSLVPTSFLSPSIQDSAGVTPEVADSNTETPGTGYGSTHVALVPSREGARQATIVAGSGDGQECGDECFLWTDLPMNKNGFRYLACGLSPVASPLATFPFYRTIPHSAPTPRVHLSWMDRSSFLRVSSDALTATTDRGFRSARGNVAVREGSWYYEVHVERGNGALGAGGGIAEGEKDQANGSVPAQGSGSGSGSGAGPGAGGGNAHVRLGWGRRESNLDGPVGCDGYSYGIRDVKGEKVHFSRPKPYARSFGTGDVIGCLITLPPRSSPPAAAASGSNISGAKVIFEEHPAYIKRKRVPLKWKNQMYFEMDEYLPAREMEALVDREGKLAKAAAAAEAAKLANSTSINGNGNDNGTGDHGDEEGPGPGPGSGAKSKKVPKGNKTKNTKKTKGQAHAIDDGGEGEGQARERKLDTLPGSSISFYLNGEPLGKAFSDLYDFTPLPPLISSTTPSSATGGKRERDPTKDVLHDDGTMGYYPMISCFARGKVRVNFGPDWLRPPIPFSRSRNSDSDPDTAIGTEDLTADTQTKTSFRPMSERWDEFRGEEKEQDEQDEKELSVLYEQTVRDNEARYKASAARAAKEREKAEKKALASAKRKKQAEHDDIKIKNGSVTPSGGFTPTASLRSSPQRGSTSATHTPTPLGYGYASDQDAEGEDDEEEEEEEEVEVVKAEVVSRAETPIKWDNEPGSAIEEDKPDVDMAEVTDD